MSLLALGPAEPSDALLETVVRSVLRDDAAAVLHAEAAAVDYASASPATGGLHRVTGMARARDGTAVPWSVFVKTLQHVTLSPMHAMLPPALAERFAAEFPWRWELTQYEREADRMPEGLRTPILHAVDEVDERRCVLWMEDVRQSPTPWTVDRYSRAARALGRFAGQRTAERRPEPSPFPDGHALRMYVEGHVKIFAFPQLHDHAVWRSPLLAGVDGRLRHDLLQLAGQADRWLDRLATLPHMLAHGDASPQNLLASADDAGFVAIDWGFGSPQAAGFDLGQLLLGLVQAGEADAAHLPAVHSAILPAYLQGLADEDVHLPEDVVRFGYVASMVLRSAFTGLMWERLGEPRSPALERAFRRRALMTRFVVDLGLAERAREAGAPTTLRGWRTAPSSAGPTRGAAPRTPAGPG